MDDFERRLTSRLAAYEESVPAPTRPSETAATARTARSRPSRWMLLIPAAAVVVVGVAFGLAGSGLLSGLRPVGNAPATSLEWTTRPFVPGAHVVALTAIGDRLIATGSLKDEAAAWYSDDGGETWTPSTVDFTAARTGAALAGMPHEIGALAPIGGRLVGLDAYWFSSAQTRPGGGATHTGVWISDDQGSTWGWSAGIDGQAEQIAQSPAGLIAIGTADVTGNGEGRLAAAWSSVDGETWKGLSLAGIDAGSAWTSVAFDGSRLMAVGSAPAPAPSSGETPAAWLSTDGSRWTYMPLDPALVGEAAVVVTSSTGFHIGGGAYSLGDLGEQPRLWQTVDGSTLSTQALQDDPSTVAEFARSIAINDLGSLVAVRSNIPASSAQDRLWFIPSAPIARPVEQSLKLQVSAITALSDRFVMISQCGASSDCENPTVSIGASIRGANPGPSPPASPTAAIPASPAPLTSPSPAAVTRIGGFDWHVVPFEQGATLIRISTVGDRVFMAGSDASGPAIWYSDDAGTRWTRSAVQRADATVDRAEWAGRIVELDDRLVSVGSIELANSGGNEARRTGAVWISTDGGTSWSAIPEADAPPVSRDVIAGGPGVIVSGQSDGGGSEIWTSTNGAAWRRVTDVTIPPRAAITGLGGSNDNLTAGGFTVDEEAGVEHPAAWHSADGVHWQLDEWTLVSATFAGVTTYEGDPFAIELLARETRTVGVYQRYDGHDWYQGPLIDLGDNKSGFAPSIVAAGSVGAFAARNDPNSNESTVWAIRSDSDTPLLGDGNIDLVVRDAVALPDRFLVLANCGPTADCASDSIIIGQPSSTAPPAPSATPDTDATAPLSLTEGMAAAGEVAGANRLATVESGPARSIQSLAYHP